MIEEKGIERGFSFQSYQKLILKLIEKQFFVKNFDNAEPEKKHLILRHDVDMSLKYAVKMAQVEKDIGVSSTYFVLLRGDLYNLLTKENELYIHSILSMGHSIGLHFDASLYDQDRESIESAVAAECKILEGYIGRDIEVLSFHRPAKALYGYESLLAGRIHAYQPKFFHDMEYCSDSKGGWHHGHPLDRNLNRAMQLLTHPIWWAFSESESVDFKLLKYCKENSESFEAALGRNCVSFIKNGLQ